MRGLVCYGEEKKEEKILLGGVGFLNIYVRRGEGFWRACRHAAPRSTSGTIRCGRLCFQ